MRINNTDMAKAGVFVEEVKADPKKAIKEKKVGGEWIFEEEKPQFRAVLKHGDTATVVEADGPAFMGGGSALKPDPVQYCLFGLAACFAQTLASVAAEKGIKFGKLNVTAENKMNLRKALGLGDEPVVESVKLSVSVSGENAEELMRLAKERCPGVYCLTHPVRLDIERVE